MAFSLSLLYIVLTYLSPANLFPSLAPYHVQLWIGLLALVGLAATASEGGLPFEAPQFKLMLGFMAAICLSHLSHLRIAGAVGSLQDFLASGISFFTVLGTARSASRVKKLLTALILISLYLLTRSVIALQTGGDDDLYVLRQVLEYDSVSGAPLVSIDRIRSVGVLSDPNDFAQILLLAMPFLAFFWQPGRWLRNLWVVILPEVYLVYGVLLTRSRGALLGIVTTVVFGFGHRLGKVMRVVVAVVGLSAIIVASKGSRDISTHDESALGRLDAWGVGISMLKSAPIFGTGYNTFLDYNELTAHNSFVLCFAELGIVGYFFWLALIVSSFMQLTWAIDPANHSDEEVRQLSQAVRVALITYLATCWFLSRTYTVTIYLLVAISASLYLLARERSEDGGPAPSAVAWRKVAVLVEVATITLAYVFVRLRGV